MNEWKVGDRVRWVSAAWGRVTEKRGTIFAVVPAGVSFRHFIPPELEERCKFGTASVRYTSYIVAVPRTGNPEVVDYYRPRPSDLRADVEVGNDPL